MAIMRYKDSQGNLHTIHVIRGPRGYSNYELAVQDGYKGTLTEWLNSFDGVVDTHNNSETAHPDMRETVNQLKHVIALISGYSDETLNELAEYFTFIQHHKEETKDGVVITKAEKEKLAGIETGANKTTVDSALSETSTNPVQNKVVFEELGKKMPMAVVVESEPPADVSGYADGTFFIKLKET